MMNRHLYKEKYFWNLIEVLDPNGLKAEWALGNADILALANAMTGYVTPVIANSEWKSAYYASVLDLVVKRYKRMFVITTEENNLPLNERYNFIEKMLNILEMTAPKYAKLLELYASSDDKLLDKIGTHSEGKVTFNDTPQDAGDYDDDPHTTNITKDTRDVGQDGDTPMGRLAEIQNEFDNLILRWSNEFDSLFIEEGNV